VIARDGRFPGWLGLLGIALQVTEEAEGVNRVLTSAWGEQLLSLMPEHARTGSTLAAIVRDQRTILTWPNLEEIEHAHEASALHPLEEQ
jgi:hypothetical protein